MKVRVILLILLMPFMSNAQTWVIQNNGVKTTVNSNGSFAADSILRLSTRDTTKPSWWNTGKTFNGAIQLGLDGLLYYYSGGYWRSASGGGGGAGTVTSVTSGNGLVSTPNPITTAGTLRVDTGRGTTQIATGGSLTKVRDSLNSVKQNNITLTTSGTSGASTLIGSTLNIPNYNVTPVTITATPPIFISGGTPQNITADTGRGQGQLATGGSLNKVKDSLNVNISLKAPIASPTFTGIVTTPALTVTGLVSGTTNDSFVVADATSGVFRRIALSRIPAPSVGSNTQVIVNSGGVLTGSNDFTFSNAAGLTIKSSAIYTHVVIDNSSNTPSIVYSYAGTPGALTTGIPSNGQIFSNSLSLDFAIRSDFKRVIMGKAGFPASGIADDNYFGVSQLMAFSTTPVITLNTAAGTGASYVVTGTPNGYIVELTTGTTPAASGIIFTASGFLTSSVERPTTFSPANQVTATLGTAQAVWLDGTTSTDILRSNTVALAASTVYKWKFNVTPKM